MKDYRRANFLEAQQRSVRTDCITFHLRGHDHYCPRAARLDQSSADAKSLQKSIRAAQHVETKCSPRFGRSVSVDCELPRNHGSNRGLADIASAIDPGINQHVDARSIIAR